MAWPAKAVVTPVSRPCESLVISKNVSWKGIRLVRTCATEDRVGYLMCNSLDSTLPASPTSRRLSDTEQHCGSEFPIAGLPTKRELETSAHAMPCFHQVTFQVDRTGWSGHIRERWPTNQDLAVRPGGTPGLPLNEMTCMPPPGHEGPLSLCGWRRTKKIRNSLTCVRVL